MAVYTHISWAELAQFLERYDLGMLISFEGIAQGVSNSNYHVFTDHGRYILTLFEERRVNYDDLPFFFAFSRHLAERGVVCPQAIEDREGDIVNSLKGCAASFLNFLEGQDLKPADITPDHCRQMGVFLAKMHLSSQEFSQKRPNMMGVECFPDLLEKVKGQANNFQDGLLDLLNDELSYLRSCWPVQDALPRGTVHADVFPDNVFFQDDDVCGVIDFYFSCDDFYAYDLAVTLNAWCFNVHGVFEEDRYKAFLKGYETVRALGADEKDALPVFQRGGVLRILLSRLEEYFGYDPEATLMTPHDPGEYLKKLLYYRGNKA